MKYIKLLSPFAGAQPGCIMTISDEGAESAVAAGLVEIVELDDVKAEEIVSVDGVVSVLPDIIQPVPEKASAKVAKKQKAKK